MEEVYFFYQEHLEYTRLYLWYQDSKFSLFTGKANKVEAERYRYLSNYYWQKAVDKARKVVRP
jgi:hypothetical protein